MVAVAAGMPVVGAALAPHRWPVISHLRRWWLQYLLLAFAVTVYGYGLWTAPR